MPKIQVENLARRLIADWYLKFLSVKTEKNFYDIKFMQNNPKKENQELPKTTDQGLSLKEIADESTNKPADETLREVLRGDESKGDADERDVAGSPDSIDTPQGREEAKKDQGSNS